MPTKGLGVGLGLQDHAFIIKKNSFPTNHIFVHKKNCKFVK